MKSFAEVVLSNSSGANDEGFFSSGWGFFSKNDDDTSIIIRVAVW
jgi:hypothetical protein